ncbi:hypothetical protein E6C67_08350 [Azospirillum sp. TSA2s]|uniref:hypothetical protein n=1 Tax=Azospirillum sp. TSA2s TaxID=709810 RepID=UPI0010AA6B55|nr:hypothetical protein [Azospirillum sp. TSA2s]QCG93949.1 hypothetical protein E6C67_08350 [Azospirillum sp. TSA2s]
MPACLHCGKTAGHFDGCPLSVTDALVSDATGALTLRRTVNTDAPICGPARLNDSLDKLAQTLAERTREW